VFLISVSYYIRKTVREPLVLAASVPQVLQGLGVHDTATEGSRREVRPFQPDFLYVR
jgi:hypothetical protein